MSLTLLCCVSQTLPVEDVFLCIKGLPASYIQYEFNPFPGIADSVAEWLRRWIANPLLYERVGSNPITVEDNNFVSWDSRRQPLVVGSTPISCTELCCALVTQWSEWGSYAVFLRFYELKMYFCALRDFLPALSFIGYEFNPLMLCFSDSTSWRCIFVH